MNCFSLSLLFYFTISDLLLIPPVNLFVLFFISKISIWFFWVIYISVVILFYFFLYSNCTHTFFLNFFVSASLFKENPSWGFSFLSFFFLNFTILYWFCHTSTWIHHGYTHVPHPEPPSHLPPRTIPLGHPSAPDPSILYPALNLDRRFLSYILYMFQCHPPKSSPSSLSQSPKDCSIHLCLFCCLTYRVIVTIFINSIYMRKYTVLVFLFLAYFTLYNRL